MKTAQLNCNTDIDINRKLCGLTILERTILSCYYAGFKKIEIIRKDDDDIVITDRIKELPDLQYALKVSKDKPFKENSFSKGTVKINVSSIINKEYVAFLAGEPVAPNSVYQELTDKASYKAAEKAILNSCRKPGEAFSSHYYRYLSLFFTKYVCRTSITPNMVTAFFVFIAALGSVMIISDLWYIYFLGLILQPMAIVFDCVDGELARVTYQYSKSGEWLDTVGDNLCTLFFVIAIAYKHYELNPSDAALVLGIVSVIIYVLNVVFLFITLSKTTDSGSLQAISKELKKKGFLAGFVTVALKRNLVTLYFMVLGFFYLTGTILVLNIAGGLGMLAFSFITLAKLKKR